ncbi:MAG: hypothetical protein IKX63_05970, partial [Muribaculaceae bacterium]|nr:hypothetical protein [Muribaculaceae bacterium]
NLEGVTRNIQRWRDDYVAEDAISAASITAIYNYLLGIETVFDEKLDIVADGVINAVDITAAYNFLLGN